MITNSTNQEHQFSVLREQIHSSLEKAQKHILKRNNLLTKAGCLDIQF